MTTEVAEAAVGPKRGFKDRLLDGIEKAVLKVPHPVIMFIYLILSVAVPVGDPGRVRRVGDRERRRAGADRRDPRRA